MALNGHLDTVDRDRVTGWAQDSEAPNATVSLLVTANHQVIARVVANLYRPDLEAAGIGNGRHGFTMLFDKQLSAFETYQIAVTREEDGAELTSSPQTLEAASTLTAQVRETIKNLLLATSSPSDAEDKLRFLNSTGQLLRQRWVDRNEPRVAIPNTRRPKALVVDVQRPTVGRDAGSNAIISHMASLRRIGFDVDFMASEGSSQGGLEAQEVECFGEPFFSSVEDLLRTRSGMYRLVYLHRIACAANYLSLVRQHQPRARILYSVADLHGLRLSRQAEVEQRHDLKAHAEHVRFKELVTALQADAVITHSSEEARLLSSQVHPSKIFVVPWAIPPRPTAAPFASRNGIAFLGGYRHVPNVDAAFWLAEEVMPLVRELDSSIRCYLYGSHMPKVLRDLRSDNVEPSGFIDNLADIFDRVRLTVAPLAFGAGIKGKVLDSLAYGVPCLCTPAAAEGIALPGALAEMVSGSPEALAEAIVRLHTDEELNGACSQAGLAYIADRHTDDVVDRLLAEACKVKP